MNKLNKIMLLTGCVFSLSACVEDTYNPGYYSSSGSVSNYQSTAVNSGYNRDYQQNTQETYVSTQSAGGGYSSSGSEGGYSSSQRPSRTQNIGGYSSSN
jgi:hypothetical protein